MKTPRPIPIEGQTFRQRCAVNWGAELPGLTTEDEPFRCTCCGTPMRRDTAWPTCGACGDCPF